MAITNLTNTTWLLSLRSEDFNNIGIFDIDGIANNYDTQSALPIQEFSSLGLGYNYYEGQYTPYIGSCACVDNPHFYNYWFDQGDGVISLTFHGGDDVDNPTLISALQTYGEMVVPEPEPDPPSDLTGYTVFVPAGWSATAGYGIFDVSGLSSYTSGSGNYYEDYQFSTLNIGYFRTSPSDETVSFANVGYESSTSPDYPFTLTFTGGDDVTDPDLIQWFVDNNAKFAPSDLTGWTVTVPSGWSAEADYGVFNINTDLPNANDNTQLYIGYSVDIEQSDVFVPSSNKCAFYFSLYEFASSSSFSFTVTGGSDVSKPSLIKWLADNKATFTKQEEEPEEEPETPSIPTDSISITYNGSVIATLLEGETITLRTNGHTAKTDIVIRFGGVALISFTIDGTPYYAEEGMTWAEWVDSSYSADTAYTVLTSPDGIGYVTGSGQTKVIVYNDVQVVPSDSIISNGVYATQSGGSAND